MHTLLRFPATCLFIGLAAASLATSCQSSPDKSVGGVASAPAGSTAHAQLGADHQSMEVHHRLLEAADSVMEAEHHAAQAAAKAVGIDQLPEYCALEKRHESALARHREVVVRHTGVLVRHADLEKNHATGRLDDAQMRMDHAAMKAEDEQLQQEHQQLVEDHREMGLEHAGLLRKTQPRPAGSR